MCDKIMCMNERSEHPLQRLRISDDAMIDECLESDLEILKDQILELGRAYPHRDHYAYVVTKLRRTAARIIRECTLGFPRNRRQLELIVDGLHSAESSIQPEVAGSSAHNLSFKKQEIAGTRKLIVAALQKRAKDV